MRPQVMKAAGNVLLSADRTGTVSMWDLNTGTSTLTIATGHTDMLMAMWVEESYLFTASLDGRVKTWQSDGTPLYEHGVTNQHGQPSGITALLLTTEKDGGEPVLITACNDNALKMWKMPTFDRRGILGSKAGHADIVRCMAKGPGACRPPTPPRRASHRARPRASPRRWAAVLPAPFLHARHTHAKAHTSHAHAHAAWDDHNRENSS